MSHNPKYGVEVERSVAGRRDSTVAREEFIKLLKRLEKRVYQTEQMSDKPKPSAETWLQLAMVLMRTHTPP